MKHTLQAPPLRFDMIYIFEDMDRFDDTRYAYALKGLSAQRLEYIDRFRRPDSRRLSVISYLLLSYGLRLEYNIDEPQDFTYSGKGKPYLKNHGGIFFSMSHCKNGVCCAVSDSEVGIDIESIKNIRPAIVRKVCSDEERTAVESSSAPDREFIRLWTMKEAYLKLTGAGIGTDMRVITQKIPECGHMLCLEREGYILSCTQSLKICFLSVEQLLNFTI